MAVECQLQLLTFINALIQEILFLYTYKDIFFSALNPLEQQQYRCLFFIEVTIIVPGTTTLDLLLGISAVASTTRIHIKEQSWAIVSRTHST